MESSALDIRTRLFILLGIIVAVPLIAIFVEVAALITLLLFAVMTSIEFTKSFISETKYPYGEEKEAEKADKT